MAGTHVKGVLVRAFVAAYASEYGQRALARVVAATEPEVRAAFDVSRPALGILPWRWYPSEHTHALLDAATRGLTNDEIHDLARAANRQALTALSVGPFRWLAALVGSPEMYARHVQRLWEMLHDTGRRSIRFVSPVEAESFIWDWDGHHPVLCRSVHETTSAVFELVGCEGITVERTECVEWGHGRCTSRLRWGRR